MWFQVFTLLHLFFAISFVASLVVGEVNSAAARRTESWNERSALFGAVKRSSAMGMIALVLLAVFGNLMLKPSGYSMATDAWPRWVMGMWLVLVVFTFAVRLPALNAIVKASGEGSAGNYQRAQKRWTIASGINQLVSIVLLVLMVFHWRG